jgi:hypothetical protein
MDGQRGTERRVSDGRSRATATQALTFAVMFLGGAGAGLGLATWRAPGSFAAQVVGMFTFSLPFAIGMQWWLGTALLLALWGLVTKGPRTPLPGEVPGGAIVFVPVCAALVTTAGLLVGALATPRTIVATTALYLAVGVLYGVACWRLARSGYLPFPQG